MSLDLSRSAFDPRKRYASVRMQQGRVLLDDDFNEAERIDNEDERRVLLDVVGPTGTPDDGFRVQNGRLNAAGELTFDVLPGTLYLGGLRIWNHALHTYAAQEDWLQQPQAERAPPANGRVDLVYLEVWQQSVTAVEDAELFEAALAGPDTSGRLRTMWRVHLASGVQDSECSPAWTTLTTSWQAQNLGVLAESGERQVNAELMVGLEPGITPADLCSPAVAGGYLGAENQAIRVQLVDASHFVWGFDNAAPLYRAQVAADRATITLETEPKDSAHFPLAGQIVEILAWSAVLPNGEKVSDVSGHLSRVAGSYDPDTHILTLSTPLPAGFGEAWQGREDQAELGPPYYFVHVWNRGDDQASPVTLPFTPGTPVALGNTGLNVTFTGSELVRDDFWIIAARPETPDQVVPWLLESGRWPHGTRRFYTPLAVIRWQVTPSGASFELLSDCRVPFHPLTRLRGCCTYTVGDKKTSFGQFSSIQDAVNHLPASGGKICVLPGEYRESALIYGRRNVTIEGCGRRSKILVPPQANAGIHVIGSQNITVRSLFIDAGARVGILLVGAETSGELEAAAPAEPSVFARAVVARGSLERILLEDLDIHARGLPAVASMGGRKITLRTSRLLGLLLEGPIGRGDLGRWPLVYMLSDDVLIEHNEIVAAAERASNEVGIITFTRTAMGGVQIGGGSERVEIRRNTIRGGNGHGIVLGSIAWVRRRTATTNDFPALSTGWIIAVPGWHFTINDEGCVEVDWDPQPPPSDNPDDPLVPVSMGALDDVRIVDNVIEQMGGAGIGVVRFFDLSARDEFIVTDRLSIEENRIRRCLRLPIRELPPGLRGVAAAGAVALAAGTRITVRDNLIEQNGRRHVDPVCGVFMLLPSGIVIEQNQIVDNAPRIASEEPARPGLRGGVVLVMVRPPTTLIQTAASENALRGSGFPALRIASNIVVVPEGRALQIAGLGAMAVTSNQLTSRGVGAVARASNAATLSDAYDALGGEAVAIVNTGYSNELGGQLLRYTGLRDVAVRPKAGLDPLPPVLTGGDVLFNDNQVKLDLMEAPVVSVMSSIFIVTMDDLSFVGNQAECEQDRDALAVNLLAFGWSLRINDNRFEEALIAANGIVNGISAYGLGVLGTMTSNQASHCLALSASMRVFANNIELIRAFVQDACGRSRRLGETLGNRYVGENVAVVD